MKISLLTLLFIPLLSFAQEDLSTQLSKKEKKKIDRYALELCNCVNDVLSELHPKALEIVEIMAYEGQEAGIASVEKMLSEMDSDEQQGLLASLSLFDSPEFMAKIEDCDGSASLGEELKTKVDSMEGAAYDYLISFMGSEESCSIVKSMIELSESSEE